MGVSIREASVSIACKIRIGVNIDKWEELVSDAIVPVFPKTNLDELEMLQDGKRSVEK